MGENREGRAAALLPILIFLLIFLGSGFITGDFYSMPAIVAFLIALLAAFVQNRELGFAEKIKLAAQGVGDENIITMCLIFLAAGAFTGAVKAAGGVDSTVNLGLSILPSNVAVAGLFLIGCFISISMGTSVGTITALAPIAVGISQKTGFSMAVCAGAVVGGAMFGDNLSMISDTTIAAVKTQGCEMKDKFRENFLIVLPAAIVTVLLFLVLGKDASFQMQGSLDYNLFRVVPYLVVLIGALAGVNVFLVLMAGTVLSLIAGVATGAFGLGEMFTHVGLGVTGMYDITVISVIVACIVALVKEYGGIAFEDNDKESWGYGEKVKTEEDFLERYKALTVGIKSLPYVCGYCYTQLSDVQQEKNGFLTEERRFKVNPEKIRAINDLPEGVFWNKKGH